MGRERTLVPEKISQYRGIHQIVVVILSNIL
jgi:hypothetical protein